MPDAQVTTLYSRPQDGAIPITVVHAPDESVRPTYEAAGITFTSARQLLIALTGHPRARNWTFDRYFKTGRHTPADLTVAGNQPPPGGTVIELFACSSKGSAKAPHKISHNLLSPLPRPVRPKIIKPADLSPEITVLELLEPPVVDESITVHPEARVTPFGPHGANLGIDLEHRGHEVVKLLFKGFGRKIYAAGYDPEEVIQEVYKGILVRNAGKCPWDPAKSSFGHYVWMVCSCVVSNFHRKQCRRRAVEQIGLPGYQDGERKTLDAGSGDAISPNKGFSPHEGPDVGLAVADFEAHLRNSRRCQGSDGRLAIRLLPLVHAGYTQIEMAQEIGVCKATVVKALDLLKGEAVRWELGQSL